MLIHPAHNPDMTPSNYVSNVATRHWRPHI